MRDGYETTLAFCDFIAPGSQHGVEFPCVSSALAVRHQITTRVVRSRLAWGVLWGRAGLWATELPGDETFCDFIAPGPQKSTLYFYQLPYV